MEAAAGASHDHWLCTWLSGGSTLPILPHGQPYARGQPCILHILPAGRADSLPGKPDREIVVVMIPFGANGSPGTRGLAGDAQRRATAPGRRGVVPDHGLTGVLGPVLRSA